MNDLLTTSDAARELGIAEATLRLWARQGKVQPAATSRGGLRLYALSEIQRLVQERETVQVTTD